MANGRNVFRSWVAAISALAFHATNGILVALFGPFPNNLDEIQHLSYIRWMEGAPRLFPRYQDMRVLDVRGAHFTQAVNYLNHPSPYYLLMGAVDRVLGGSTLGLRFVDLGLSLGGVALLLWAAYRVLGSWKERAVFAAALVLFPQLGVVAGLINNDDAALLATGVAFLGLIEWQRRPSGKTALILGLGVALCGWTKLTVLLMIGFSVLIAEALRFWSGQKRAGPAAYIFLVLGFLAGAAPSLVNVLTYHRVLYHSSAFYVSPARRVSLSFINYTLFFLRNMVFKWSALEPTGVLAELGLYMVLALAVTAVFVGLRQMKPGRPSGPGPDAGAGWRAACAMILAICPVLLIHIGFGWRTFVEDGFIEMAQDRYYYGLWPGVALGLALLWKAADGWRFRLATTSIAAAFLISSSVAAPSIAMLARGQTTIG